MIENRLQPWEHVSEKVKPYKKIFLGGQFGIVLKNRGENDNHVCFQILNEDDGNWFISETGTSSSWLDDLKYVLTETEKWIKKNCEPDLYDGRQFGWKFKNKTENRSSK